MFYVIVIIIYFRLILKSTLELSIPLHCYPFIPIMTMIGFRIGDFFSGIFHYILDTFNFSFLASIHENFRKHHDDPLSMENFSLLESVGELMPIGIGVLLFLKFDNQLLQYTNILSNIIFCMTQINHRLSHRRTHEKDKNGDIKFYIPWFIKYLQDKNFILHPEHHQQHHKTEIMHYCISNGLTSKFLDKIIYLFNLPVSTYKRSNGVHKIYYDKKSKNKLIDESEISDTDTDSDSDSNSDSNNDE